MTRGSHGACGFAAHSQDGNGDMEHALTTAGIFLGLTLIAVAFIGGLASVVVPMGSPMMYVTLGFFGVVWLILLSLYDQYFRGERYE